MMSDQPPSIMNDSRSVDPRTGLSVERTLLAWVRTGLSMMGFGFVVERFGLFLRELRTAEHINNHVNIGVSFIFGAGLMILGVAILILAAFYHIRLMRKLASGEQYVVSSISFSVIVTFLLAIFGLAMTGFMIYTTL